MKPFCQSVRLPLAVSAGERRQQQQVVQIVNLGVFGSAVRQFGS